MKSAYRQASVERAAWPYPWLAHEAYAPPQARGGMEGKLIIGEKRSAPVSDGANLEIVQFVGGG